MVRGRRDIWGEVITRDVATGPDVLSPIFESRLKNDPVTKELIRLGVGPGRISEKIGDVELTGKHYDELQFLAGRYLRQELENSMNHPRYQTSLDADKIDGVRNIIAATRVQARAMIRKRYPSIDLRAAKAEMDRLGMVR